MPTRSSQRSSRLRSVCAATSPWPYFLLAGLSAVIACGNPPSGNSSETVATPTTTPEGQPEAILPSQPGAFAPALMSLGKAEGPLDGAHLSDVDTCGGCHPDVFVQQQASAHGVSSFNNPVYRFAIDRFRKTISKAASQVCGGCHDMALMIDGVMPNEVEPTDERAHAGITCRVCHGIESATDDGNGSYVISRQHIKLPIDGDAESIEIHKKSAHPIDHEELCGSCHRSFLGVDSGNDHFLAGMDDLSGWRNSAYNLSGIGRIDDELPKTTCVDCHMQLRPARLGDVAADKEGNVRSHRFLGGHTWLASMLDDDAQLARQQEFLRDTMTIDIAAAFDGSGTWYRPADAAPASAGTSFGFDVVLRNIGVGHRFPGGVRDAVDSWVEIAIADSTGKVISKPAAPDHTHRLRVLMGNKDAQPQFARNTQDFYEVIVDHTIAARDARVVRFEFDIPKSVKAEQFPLHLTAKLMHRSRNLEVQKGACEAYESERGQEFAKMQTTLGKPVLNPCKPQPITVVAETQTWIGEGAAKHLTKSVRAMAWKRQYEHALGLLGELPKEARVAKNSLEKALEEVEVSGDPRDKAMIYASLGRVYTGTPCGPMAPKWPSCAERLKIGLSWLDKAEAIVPNHPAVGMTRAKLYDARSMYEDSVISLIKVSEKVPKNSEIWRQLSASLLSLGRTKEALKAAQTGLKLLPRDDELLRVQSRALVQLHSSPDSIERSARAYDEHSRAERPVEMRAACAKDPNAECARERLTVHTHTIELAP